MKNITDVIQYTDTISSLLPGAKVFKLIGYTKGNADYQKAKTPAIAGWQKPSYKTISDNEVNKWIAQGGWIGTLIPEKRIVIDLDNSSDGALLKELLEGENIHHHSIKTPNGWQFIFKSETEATMKINQINKYISRLGLMVDTRTSEKGYIVFPTETTENRLVVSQSLEKLDELPQYLIPTWNGKKTPSPMVYPYDGSGSRNGDFYDLARRLLFCKVPIDEVQESLSLAYEYFVTEKNGFTLDEIKSSIKSAFNKVSEGDQGDQGVLKIEYDEDKEVTKSSSTSLIPRPFSIRGGSLYKTEIKRDAEVKKMISRKVPVITKELHNVERPQVLYAFEWNEKNKIIKEVVPASTIAIRKELLELSEKGFSVNENNAKTIIEYLDLFLLNNNIERQYAVERLGSIKDQFIHPLLVNGVEIIALDHGEQQLKEGFEVKGTSETWKNEVFSRIQDCPKAVFFVLASFASVLIKDLRINPFIVDLSGTTSQGKTTTLKAATSVWGNESLMSEWNATKVSIERKAAYLNSFPLMLDDTRKADERTLKHIIYQFSGGRSKGRGSLKGSQREYTWNNILLSTGEVSLNDYIKNEGGAAARIIPLVDEPLKKDAENITGLNIAMENNYGAIGIDFLKVWLDNKNELMSEFQKFKNHYINKSKGNEVLARLSAYYAAVHFTGSLLKEKMNMDIDLVAISNLFDDIAEENKAIDKPKQFLEEILTDLDSSRQDIFYEYQPVVTKAIYKKGILYLMPAYINRFLGVEEKSTRREWLKRGLTVGEQKKDVYVDYRAIFHKGKTYRAVPVNMDLVKEIGFEFSEEIFFK